MHRHNPQQWKHAEIDEVFDRMHRDARPGPGINITVMHLVRDFIQRLPMHRPVNQVKVVCPPEKNPEYTQQLIQGMVDKCWQRNITVGVDPEGHNFISRTNADA